MNENGKHPNLDERITRRLEALETHLILIRMQTNAMRSEVNISKFKSIHKPISWIENRRNLNKLERHYPKSDLSKSGREYKISPRPPPLGEFLLSILIPVEKQKERIADFEEMFVSVWVPKFGVRRARLIYLWQAGGVLFRTAFFAWIIERFSRVMGS